MATCIRSRLSDFNSDIYSLIRQLQSEAIVARVRSFMPRLVRLRIYIVASSSQRRPQSEISVSAALRSGLRSIVRRPRAQSSSSGQ
jgi:hypothetical protein